MSGAARSRGAGVLLAAGWLAAATIAVSAQALTLAVRDAVIYVKPARFGFIDDGALARLKNGQAVELELAVAALAAPGGAPVVQSRVRFTVSYDLWEERFAATRSGSASPPSSHRTTSLVEAWCLEQVSVPTNALGRLGHDTPLWIRVEHRLLDRARPPDRDDDRGFTLGTLIDILSRRRAPGANGGSVEAGPFRLAP